MIGVAVLVVIGVALLALAPAKQAAVDQVERNRANLVHGSIKAWSGKKEGPPC